MIEKFLVLFETTPAPFLLTKQSNDEITAAYLNGFYLGVFKSIDIALHIKMNSSQLKFIQDFIYSNPKKNPFNRTNFFLLANDDSGIFPIEVNEIYRNLHPIIEYIFPRRGFYTKNEQSKLENLARLTLKQLKTDEIIDDNIQKYCKNCMKERMPILRTEIYKLMLNIE